MIVMRRFGMDREQAIEHLNQCVEDEQEVSEMGISLPPKGAPVNPEHTTTGRFGGDAEESKEVSTGNNGANNGTTSPNSH